MKNRQRLGKTTVAIVVSTLAFSNCAWGLPQGGTVVTGNGSYTSSGNQMDITGTGNVSVKWDSFNVAAGLRAYLMSIQLYKILKTALVSVILG